MTKDIFTSDFEYILPEHLIAQTPIEPRDYSRLMHLDRSSHKLTHHTFYDIGSLLREGDLLIVNNSRVLPARLLGTRPGTGGAVEILLLHREGSGKWKSLVKPGRRLREGSILNIGNTQIQILQTCSDGTRIINIEDESVIYKSGLIPLPPYIKESLTDQERYQTVYSKKEGSAAAPTAGLHFTDSLLESLQQNGIKIAEVTLHIGLDTFRPVSADSPKNHEIHSEYFELSESTANEINMARQQGRRIICVGTTSVRVLEQVYALCQSDGSISLTPRSGWANLFILPGHKFGIVDGMITNFHLPKSTLLMLISAFAGRDFILEAYHKAISLDYRFYSFGDAMLIT